AKTLSDSWPYEQTMYYASSNFNNIENLFEKGERGKWRELSSYSFRDTVAGFGQSYVYTTNTKNYNSGVYDLEVFNWSNPAASMVSGKWLKLNTITQYSPNGNALEEENILGISSTAKFGYHETQPYLIAKNASNKMVYFESFENTYLQT